MCRLCDETPKQWVGDDRKCAFPNGVFSADNWNCATVAKLRSVANRNALTKTIEDSHFAVIPMYPDGWIVLSWYKERGRMSQAMLVNDDVREPLTLQLAMAAIERIGIPKTLERIAK
ncbi:hypothetical protein M0R72_21815 [Candidatus Pacearchaeota archaeon]|jgi:hypothetical protein|nr:hypothetical protein [Candidatus Pacearchaeota archaeon]